MTWTPDTGDAPTHPNRCENELPQNEAVAWVADTPLEAVVAIESTPAPTQRTPVWIVGTPSNLPTLTRPPLTLDPGTSNYSTEVIGSSKLPAHTSYTKDLATGWIISGQPTQPDPAMCQTAGTCIAIGTSTNTLYVLLKAPQDAIGEGTGITRTAIHLATQGTAVDSRSALTQTWAQFSGNNTKGWDDRPLFYYNSQTNPQQGLTPCGPDSNLLLTQQMKVGDSCAWAQLFLEALAMNGIPVYITPTNTTILPFLPPPHLQVHAQPTGRAYSSKNGWPKIRATHFLDSPGDCFLASTAPIQTTSSGWYRPQSLDMAAISSRLMEKLARTR